MATRIYLFVLTLTVLIPGILTGNDIVEQIRNRIENSGNPPVIIIGDEVIHASYALPLFYERRGYQPAWREDKKLSSNCFDLVEAISKARDEGLNPDDYHLKRIQNVMQQLMKTLETNQPRPELMTDLELLLTDAYFIYATHLLSGRVNPISIDPEWIANLREADLIGLLEKGLAENNITGVLAGLLPHHPAYGLLKKALARYRLVSMEGGWSPVPTGPALQEGDSGERVVILRKRLRATGDCAADMVAEDFFDESLREGVMKFQRRHGLDIDGKIGPKTLEALNVPVEKRIEQIRLNLERWRWLPQELGSRYVIINVANFDLDVVENDTTVMSMRTVVGKPFRKTPVFSDKVTYLVFSPFWTIPASIARNDILPQAKKDPESLIRQNIRVYTGQGSDKKEIDPKAVDWSAIKPENLSNWFRQDPGPNNALGGVKFMFPNKFNIYIHDTPAKGLFAKSTRNFSSGCIRIEKPAELAEYLLKGNGGWPQDRILNAMNKGTEETIRLANPIPIHLLYWTAWANEDGEIDFRNDIYNRDKPLLDALDEQPQVETSIVR